MTLDEIGLDSGDGISSSQEAPQEKSEKQKESSRRAQAQLQKTQKDEKKAKTDNDDLFLILSRFIKNPFYETLIIPITNLMQHEYPSRFLLALIALVFPEASVYILDKTGFHEKKQVLHALHRSAHPIPFDEASLDPSLREWITLWLTATERFLTSEDVSVILTDKLISLLSGGEHQVARTAVGEMFYFFFREKNIEISREKSVAYSEFILSQLRASLESAVTQMDTDLRSTQSIESRDLFGI